MVGNRGPWPDWRRKRARGRPKTVEPRFCKEEVEEEWAEEEAEDPGSSDWWPPFQPRQPRPPPGPPPDRWASWDDGDCEPVSAPSTPSLASQSTSATSLPAAKPELGDSSSSSEDELGQYLALLNKGPPKPKKMPKPKPRPPVSGASVATSKYPPPKRGPSSMAPPTAPEAPKRLRLEEPEKRTIIRPSTKAGRPPLPTSAKAPMAPPPVAPPPVVPSPIRPPLVSAPVQVTPANSLRIGRARTSVPVVPPRGQLRLTRETSTGLMVDPPPVSELRDSRPCPFPGPPPVEDPPYWALQQPLLNSQLALPPSHLPLALPPPPPPPPLDSEPESLAPMTDALALCEPSSGDGIISIDIDEDAIAVANVLQQDSQHAEFYELLKEFQRKAAHALKGANAPVCIDVRLGGQVTDLPEVLAPGGPSVSSMPSMPSDTGSGYYSNNGNWSDALPPSFAAERIVNAKDVRFSQKSMKRRFQDGRSLEELIQGLMRGTYNPMTDEFLKLTVVEKSDAQGNPALYSKDNRRLYCLHEYQRRICAERVPVRVRILAWQDVVDACKFQRNYDTEQDGNDITLRN